MRLKIGIIDIKDECGGVRTFINNFYDGLNKYTNFIVEKVDLDRTSISKLNEFDILHFSSLDYYSIWKLFFIFRPKKVITVHGWIKDESINSFKEKNSYKKIKYFINFICYTKSN